MKSKELFPCGKLSTCVSICTIGARASFCSFSLPLSSILFLNYTIHFSGTICGRIHYIVSVRMTYSGPVIYYLNPRVIFQLCSSLTTCGYRVYLFPFCAFSSVSLLLLQHGFLQIIVSSIQHSSKYQSYVFK